MLVNCRSLTSPVFFLSGLDGAEVDRTIRTASRHNEIPHQVRAIGRWAFKGALEVGRIPLDQMRGEDQGNSSPGVLRRSSTFPYEASMPRNQRKLSGEVLNTHFLCLFFSTTDIFLYSHRTRSRRYNKFRPLNNPSSSSKTRY